MTNYRFNRAPLAALLATSTVALTGCAGMQSTVVPTRVSIAGLQGSVFGGQQPIKNSTIQVYQAGAAYGSGSTALIASTVTTGVDGSFNISGLYHCDSGSQLYITATGGDAGAGTNSDINLITGLGPCDGAPSLPFIEINEVTTVATVWALAPFMNGSNIGAPASNQTGFADAFADIKVLTDIGTGLSPGPSAPAGSTIPTDKIYALADVLSACVNSSGDVAGSSCSKLIADTTIAGVAPTDTLTAAISIARHPGSKAATILALMPKTPPFSTTYVTGTDLTLAVTYRGGGLNHPSGVAVDGAGNIWIANKGNAVSEFSHTGLVASGTTGFTAGSLNAPSAIAVDTSNNIWIANAGNSTLTELRSDGSDAPGSPFSGGGLSTPTAVAVDAFGYVWISNAGNASVSEFSSTGSPSSPAAGFPGTGTTMPIGIAVTAH